MNAYSGQVKRPCIILITGPMAAGKSTVAQAVAERLPQSVHAFDRILRTETPRFGYWLDTSDLTIAETVDAILNHIAQATGTREGEG